MSSVFKSSIHLPSIRRVLSGLVNHLNPIYLVQREPPEVYKVHSFFPSTLNTVSLPKLANPQAIHKLVNLLFSLNVQDASAVVDLLF